MSSTAAPSRCLWIATTILSLAIPVTLCGQGNDVYPGDTNLTNVDANAHKANRPLPEISEEDDALLHFVRNTRFGFVIIGASEYPLHTEDNRPFAKNAAESMAALLQSLHYESLYRPLYGADATMQNIESALEQISNQPPEAVVVLYYVGHGTVYGGHPDDITLGVADRKLEDGIPLFKVLYDARGQGAHFQGRLVVIVDACHAGQALLSKHVQDALADGTTTLLTADRLDETAERLVFDSHHQELTANCGSDPAAGSNETTALSYYTDQALNDDWDAAEDQADGILTYDKLKRYLKLRFLRAERDKVICGKMTPLLEPDDEVLLAYRRDKVVQWNGKYRSIVVVVRGLIPQPVGATQTNVTSIVYRIGQREIYKVTLMKGQTVEQLTRPVALQLPKGTTTIVAELLDKDSRVIDTIRVPLASPPIASPDTQGLEDSSASVPLVTKGTKKDPLLIEVKQNLSAH